ncbi:hypothetical protein BJ742DRAFT_737488 [Cladochytrium replicatum]|nr:hypothetical protein BJ742DRAFT_737488 [Cladochytrium replicatum]
MPNCWAVDAMFSPEPGSVVFLINFKPPVTVPTNVTTGHYNKGGRGISLKQALRILLPLINGFDGATVIDVQEDEEGQDEDGNEDGNKDGNEDNFKNVSDSSEREDPTGREPINEIDFGVDDDLVNGNF